jgi:hypothetical protein
MRLLHYVLDLRLLHDITLKCQAKDEPRRPVAEGGAQRNMEHVEPQSVTVVVPLGHRQTGDLHVAHVVALVALVAVVPVMVVVGLMPFVPLVALVFLVSVICFVCFVTVSAAGVVACVTTMLRMMGVAGGLVLSGVGDVPLVGFMVRRVLTMPLHRLHVVTVCAVTVVLLPGFVPGVLFVAVFLMAGVLAVCGQVSALAGLSPVGGLPRPSAGGKGHGARLQFLGHVVATAQSDQHPRSGHRTPQRLHPLRVPGLRRPGDDQQIRGTRPLHHRPTSAADLGLGRQPDLRRPGPRDEQDTRARHGCAPQRFSQAHRNAPSRQA